MQISDVFLESRDILVVPFPKISKCNYMEENISPRI